MATRGPVSTTARSLTSKAFHLVRVGGEVRRGLGSSTLEAAVEASLTQDIKTTTSPSSDPLLGLEEASLPWSI